MAFFFGICFLLYFILLTNFSSQHFVNLHYLIGICTGSFGHIRLTYSRLTLLKAYFLVMNGKMFTSRASFWLRHRPLGPSPLVHAKSQVYISACSLVPLASSYQGICTYAFYSLVCSYLGTCLGLFTNAKLRLVYFCLHYGVLAIIFLAHFALLTYRLLRRIKFSD